MRQFYLGKTKRHLITRIEEHKKQDTSAIHKHLSNCGDCQKSGVDISKFEIITTGRSDFEVTIKEALYIKKLNPVLNKQLFQKGASHLLELF